MGEEPPAAKNPPGGVKQAAKRWKETVAAARLRRAARVRCVLF